jgi:hypothetical protein
LTQYHFADESGDPGLPYTNIGTPYFIIAMVQLPEHNPLSPLSELRKKLHLPIDYEFHFHQMTDRQKNLFFQVAQDIPYRVRVAHLQKIKLNKIKNTFSGQDLIVELITTLTLRASPLDISNDLLIIDSAPPSLRRKLRIRLTETCRQLNRVRPFKKISPGKPKSEDGLQMADMIAGAVRQYECGENPAYYNTISKHMVDLWYVEDLPYLK